MWCKLRAYVLSTLVFVGWQTSVLADLIVVPGSFSGVPGNDYEQSSLGVSNNRYQQVYGSSLLDGFHIGDRITGLTFRLDGGSSPLPAQTVANYEIRLSRSVNAPGGLSLTFAANRGPDEVMVRSGPLTINSGDFLGGNTVSPFGVVIPFGVSYVYRGGPLLVEVSHAPFPLGGQPVDGHSFSPGLDAQSIFGSGPTATMANLQNAPNSAIVLEFQTAAPEPSTVVLAVIGLTVHPTRRRNSVPHNRV